MQPERSSDSIDRFSETNSAGLLPGTLAAFGSRSIFMSATPANSPRQQQNLLMAPSIPPKVSHKIFLRFFDISPQAAL